MQLSSGMTTSGDELRMRIEREVLLLIAELTRKGISKEKIQEIAGVTVDALRPGMTLSEIYKAVATIDNTHAELAPLVHKVLKEYDEQFTKHAIAQASQHVKEGNYDSAQDVVKNLLEYKMK